MLRRLEPPALRLLAAADAACNRWYGWRFNPLYQSGTIAVALYVTLVITGLWLLLFYRVGSPWESVSRLTANPWIGNWVRGLHRYATDAAIVATGVHALRMFAQGRNWGARGLAWVSGGMLLMLLLVCGWTGYVLVWDAFGEHLAREGARMVDTLPVLSEPVSRAFTGEQPVPSVFFFITLFAHVGVPLGMGVIFWLHVKRLHRPMLLPPRLLTWAVVALLTGAAVLRPLRMAARADPFTRPAEIPMDLFVAFWMPVTERLSGGLGLSVLLAGACALLLVPFLTRRTGEAKPAPSVVDAELCTGCVQCTIDCPYGAIDMVPRAGAQIHANARSSLVAHVHPELCVSCGICAGSCAPMGVGPPGRTGRDQLAATRRFVLDLVPGAGTIVAICCDHGAGAFAGRLAAAGAAVYPIGCTGNLHTSVIERLLRDGAAGLLIFTCPPRDCWHREGPRWLTERVFHGREAELQPRVPRERVRVAHVAAHEAGAALAVLDTFAGALAAFRSPVLQPDDPADAVCEPADAEAPALMGPS